MHLPCRTHTWALGPLFHSLHIRTQIELRTVAFICKGFAHTNPLVRTVFDLALSDARTSLGSNIAHFRYKFGISVFNNVNFCKNRITSIVADMMTDEQLARIQAAQELLACRESAMFVNNFSSYDINIMMGNVLCL